MPGMAETSPPLVVLVHGAWHGAWCWSALQSRLDQRGIASLAIDLPGHGASTLPLGDLHGDAQHVVEVIEQWSSDRDVPIVLVGHSYGGAVISEVVARSGKVDHLVYLTAFALRGGDSVMGQLGAMPPQQVALSAAMQMRDDGSSVLDATLAVPALYGSCAADVARAAVARLSAQPMTTFTQPVSAEPLRAIPSTYVVCTGDRAIHVEHQREMSTRCTTTVSLDTDHSPFASMPDETAEIIASVVGQVALAPTR
jgi:pimeloyl-ACP methyl ester carboxylesterase